MLKQLQEVNREINNKVRYTTDLEQYKSIELWRVAGMKGDCEDYALAKRERLLELGWPIERLKLAICYTETNEGHAVLMVDTDNGTYVLDNRYPSVKPWKSLPYKWVMRQKGKGWVRINGSNV